MTRVLAAIMVLFFAAAGVQAAELTAAERAQLIEHVRPCWPVSQQPLPAGTRATISVVTETDGVVLEASGVVASSVLLAGSYGAAERALTELARQAVMDPRCRRLPMPTRLLGHRQSFELAFSA